MKNLFFKPSPDRLARAHLDEARRLLLDHLAAAEHYMAMADMYAKRVARLEASLAPPDVAPYLNIPGEGEPVRGPTADETPIVRRIKGGKAA